jgi:thiol-disulfide isomerase/thioredoxin
MQSNSIWAKLLIGIAFLLALVSGIWFGIQRSGDQYDSVGHDHADHAGMSHEEYEAKKVKPESVTDLSFLLETELSDTQGKVFKVSEKLGQLNLVNYWATWCAPCREEMPLFNTIYEINKEKGFVVLGLTIDEAEGAERFVQQLGISYPILMAEAEGWDLLGKTGNEKNLLPYSILLDGTGQVLEQKLGILHGKELQSWIDKYL